ncbi:uncharacterized protein N7482_007661 [Penicillium canariense]|uniref:Uncharacterized protein n=1 Tax=Penicillium canariense TaxID=189055 RepID=A0A9W9HX69_9EURO|nr:uncharacterized protein N7482_007661 [Penicillium canariense]KAJ5160657.1 hypothetical protein N7482_007661 [Penicillium canariense]
MTMTITITVSYHLDGEERDDFPALPDFQFQHQHQLQLQLQLHQPSPLKPPESAANLVLSKTKVPESPILAHCGIPGHSSSQPDFPSAHLLRAPRGDVMTPVHGEQDVQFNANKSKINDQSSPNNQIPPFPIPSPPTPTAATANVCHHPWSPLAIELYNFSHTSSWAALAKGQRLGPFLDLILGIAPRLLAPKLSDRSTNLLANGRADRSSPQAPIGVCRTSYHPIAPSPPSPYRPVPPSRPLRGRPALDFALMYLNGPASCAMHGPRSKQTGLLGKQ